MNNPFTCESTVDGKRCENLGSHLYKTAFATRLICDSCAALYRAGKYSPPTPIVDVALLELIPAREVLVNKLDRLSRLNEKMKQLVAVGTKERDMLDRASMCLLLVYIVAFFLSAWGPLWVLIPVGGSYVGALFGVRQWVSRQWLPKRIEAINHEYGFPEREGES